MYVFDEVGRKVEFGACLAWLSITARRCSTNSPGSQASRYSICCCSRVTIRASAPAAVEYRQRPSLQSSDSLAVQGGRRSRRRGRSTGNQHGNKVALAICL